jgi:UDPglucose 6-dehydrogenase
MFHTVSDKQIAIWGFAFKKDTNDIRESAAIAVCRDLLEERARLVIYDPRVSEQQIRDALEGIFKDATGVLSDRHRQLVREHVTIAPDAYAAAAQTHAIAVLTEWDEFRRLDMGRVLAGMQRPAFVFDGRNILDVARLTSLGFEVHSIGRP